MSADRNLLYGMLALHAAVIDRDQLLDALDAWMLNKETPLGELLRGRGALSDDDHAHVEAIVARHLRRHGDAQRSLARLPMTPEDRRGLEGLADPDVQATLASVTPALDSTTAPGGGGAAPGFLPAATRYRRLRPHARGGLGEVSLALDEELNREVALKEIRPQFADDADSCWRFVREAEITGRLEHPGVVPVYGLGKSEEGRPVYAMRFIQGETLEAALQRYHRQEAGLDAGARSLALRELLGRFVQVCNAVAYAHRRGVIHRDLKPANIMLGEFGETLVVDWGLARPLRQPDPGQATLAAVEADTHTQVGAALGTPAYMPPEQARGEHDKVGERSDVFGLGATLYAVLTGRAPFGGGMALDAAKACRFAPPRQANPAVPKALEAICHQALAAESSRRYATARALAQDVERWLADEPVSAYQEPAAARARRWAKRHRTLVTSAVLLMAASVVGLSLGLWAVNAEKNRTASQRDRAVEAERREGERATEAEDNLGLAKQAIDECFNVVKEHPLFQEARMEKAKKLLLERTQPFYENFRSRRPDDRGLRWEEADQWYRVAYIEQTLGRPREGRAAYEKAKAFFEELVAAHPDLPQHQSSLASAHNGLGVLLGEQAKPEEALREHQAAREIRARLAAAHPDLPRYQGDLAASHQNLGVLLRAQGKGEEAIKEQQRAQEIFSRLARAYPDQPRYQGDLAGTHQNLGVLLRAQGKPEEAIKEHRRAGEIFSRLAAADPDSPRHQSSLASAHHSLGVLLSDQGKPEEAIKEYQAAREIRARLAAAHPDLPRYRIDLAGVHYNLGVLLSEQKKSEEALREYRAAREIRAQLAAAHPDLPQYQSDLAGAHNSLGALLGEQGKPEEALREYRAAREIRARLAAAHPDLPQYQGDLAGTLVNLSNLHRDLNRLDEALRAVEEALPLLLGAHRQQPRHPTYRQFLRNAHLSRARTLGRLTRHREAVADWEAVLRLEANPSFGPLWRIQRADSLARSGDHAPAAAEADEVSRLAKLSGSRLYNLACVQALNAALRPLPIRDTDADGYAAKAVALLRRSAAAGYFRDAKHVEHLHKDDDLVALRNRDDYQAFAASLVATKARP